MDRQTLTKICEQVYRRYPQVTGSQPSVQNRSDGQFLLVFRGSGRAADGRVIAQTVRVVASPSGQLITVTVSK